MPQLNECEFTVWKTKNVEKRFLKENRQSPDSDIHI